MKKSTVKLVVILFILLLVSIVFGCATAAPAPAPVPAPAPPPTPTLGIRNVELCSFISDEGDYTVQPDATFQRGDTAYLYFETPGMTVKTVDGKFECWTKFSELKLFDPNDDMIGRLVDVAEFHRADLEEPPGFGWFYAWYEITEEDISGQYRFEFTVIDELSGATGTGSATFTLK